MKPQWDEFCVICGGPPTSSRTHPAAQNAPFPKAAAWLDDWMGVTPEHPTKCIPIGRYDDEGHWVLTSSTNHSKQVFASFSEYYGFIDPNIQRHNKQHGRPGRCDCSSQPAQDDDDDDDYDDFLDPIVCPARAPAPGLHWMNGWWGSDSSWARYGVAFHRSCGQLLQQRLGYAVSFNDVWPLLKVAAGHPLCCGAQFGGSNHLRQLNYGGTEKYHGCQEGAKPAERFATASVSHADEYLLLDPLQCSKNADRIVAVWEPLVKRFQGQGGAGSAPRSNNSKSSSSGGGAGGGVSGSRARGGKAAGKAASKSSKGSAGGGAAAAAGPSQVAHGRVTRRSAKAQESDTAAKVLQLLLDHVRSPPEQLRLAATLLPLSSRMPQLLTAGMQLCIVARSVPRVQQVAAWLRKHSGQLVSSLELDAVVSEVDAGKASAAALEAISTAASGAQQGFKLLSLSLHLPNTPSATQLLQALPMTQLTSLHLTGPWKLSAAAASALTAATALRALTLPGAGLTKALTDSLCSVLLQRLQRLRLSDAGGCSAATLRGLSDQLTSLTELQLDYHPLPDDNNTPGVIASTNDPNNSAIQRSVRECWADLPALRSLSIGPRNMCRTGDFDHMELEGGEPDSHYLVVDSSLVDSITATPQLTSLTLGPSAWLDEFDGGASALSLLPPMIDELAELQQLTLTMQMSELGEDGEDAFTPQEQLEVMAAIADLPDLRDVAVCDTIAGAHLGRLAGAEQLTCLEFVCGQWLSCDTHDAAKRFKQECPGVKMFTRHC